MFIREPHLEKLEQHVSEFTLIHSLNFHANPEIDGLGSEAFVLLHFQKPPAYFPPPAKTFSARASEASMSPQIFSSPIFSMKPDRVSANSGWE